MKRSLRTPILATLVIYAFGLVTLAHADLNTGLVAYYPFNGNANDSSVNGQHGVASGVLYVQDPYGVANRAVRFQGSVNSLVLVNPVNFPPGDITVALWVRTTQTGTDRTLISFAAPVHDNSFLLSFIPTLRIDLVTDFNRISTSVAINDGTWRHVAMTWKQSNGQFLLYTNGVLVFSTTKAAGLARSSIGALGKR